jgi:uncharacterized protein (TIGR04222 family)
MLGPILASDNDWSIFDENAWLGIKGLLAVAVAGLVGRILIQFGRPRRRRPSGYALAYLAGEGDGVTYSALAWLRVRGALFVDRDSRGRATLNVGAPPPDADPVERALHRAVSLGIPPGRLTITPGVVATREPVLVELRLDGLLLSRRRRRIARAVSVIGGIGAVLVGTIVALFGIVLLFAPVGERSIVAVRLLARQRRQRPLDPNWRSLPPEQARMIVALHGVAALLEGDPDLADALGLRHRAADARGSHDGSDDGAYGRDDHDYADADDGGGGADD